MIVQQEIETLKNNCSVDMVVYESYLEECTKENMNLKTEVNVIPFLNITLRFSCYNCFQIKFQ